MWFLDHAIAHLMVRGKVACFLKKFIDGGEESLHSGGHNGKSNPPCARTEGDIS